MVYRGMGWKWKGRKAYLTHKLTKHLMLRLYIHTKWSICVISKKDTNELIYKAETDSPT